MVTFIFPIECGVTMTEPVVPSHIDDLVRDALVWDAHAGVFPEAKIDLNLLDDWRRNGADYLSINVGFDALDWQETLTILAAYRTWILSHADRFCLAGTTRDVVKAKADSKLAITFDIEGMNALNGNINLISVFHALGVRQMLFAYNLGNAAAGGCHDQNVGLSDFGRAIVREMNRCGIIVDCSHAACRTTMDIMSESTAPVVFSHSNPTAVWKHGRNITDAQIRACAQTGGVIGLNGMGIFLGQNDISTETLVDHLCYTCDLVGAEHAGLGFDYSPDIDVDLSAILKSRPDYWPPGQQYDTPNIKHAGPAQVPQLMAAMSKRGFSDNELRGILGKNFQRVAAAAWLP